MLEAITKMPHVVSSRTQLRRQQRRYSAMCFKQGALLKAKHVEETSFFEALEQSPDLRVLAHSLSIHRSDCAQLHRNVHYASAANAFARSENIKTDDTYKGHRAIHQRANKIKHEHEDVHNAPQAFSVTDPAIVFAAKNSDEFAALLNSSVS